MKRLVSIGVGVVVFGLCAVWIARTFAWDEVFERLAEARWGLFLAGSGALTLVFWLLRAVRWRLMLAMEDIRPGLGPVYLATAVAMGFAVVTPAQAGEAGKIELLKGRGLLPRAPGYGSFLVERVLDLVAVSTLFAGAALLRVDAWLALPAGLDGAALAVAVSALILGPPIGLFVATRLRLSGPAGAVLDSMRSYVDRGAWMTALFGITVLCWLATAGAWQVCMEAVGVTVGLLDSIAITTAAAVLMVLSMVPGGVGAIEVGVSQFLEVLGHAPADAQAAALVIRLYAAWTLVLGLAHWPAWKAGER